MTREQIKKITCALFHVGIDVETLSKAAKAELREAVDVLLAEGSPAVVGGSGLSGTGQSPEKLPKDPLTPSKTP